jgi:hypothetical protein
LQLEIGRSDNSVQQNEEDTVDHIHDEFPDDCCVGNVEECSHDATDEPNDAREDYEDGELQSIPTRKPPTPFESVDDSSILDANGEREKQETDCEEYSGNEQQYKADHNGGADNESADEQ